MKNDGGCRTRNFAGVRFIPAHFTSWNEQHRTVNLKVTTGENSLFIIPHRFTGIKYV